MLSIAIIADCASVRLTNKHPWLTPNKPLSCEDDHSLYYQLFARGKALDNSCALTFALSKVNASRDGAVGDVHYVM
jgi:hypothetical protein